MNKLLSDQSGVLTFEWILLITILVIGVIGGISAVRDNISNEMQDVSAAVLNLDDSYSYQTIQTSMDYTRTNGTQVNNAAVTRTNGSVKE